MSTEETPKDDIHIETADVPKSPVEPSPVEGKKRPRLDVSGLGGRDRKRGKSMFGLLVGTLNKAKIEDKERNASDAAKKRHLIEQRLQAKLRKETDSVRRAEDAKKDKTLANRREEDLQLRDSIHKLRRKRLPALSNFLLTSDVIPADDSSPPSPSSKPLAHPPRSHPPPLYYLPVVLTPAQEAFIARRKAEVAEASEKEWEKFVEERKAGVEEINDLRQRVADEIAKTKVEGSGEIEADGSRVEPSSHTEGGAKDVDMEVDDTATSKEEIKAGEHEKKEDSSAMQADDDEAVEY